DRMFTLESCRPVGTRRICAVAVLLFVLVTMPVRGQHPPPVFDPPIRFYLALGDSIAYGFQEFKFEANLPPPAYNTGYVDVFAARLRQIRPELAVVNYSCPGESTDSFVNGGCIWTETGHPLHDAYLGTQLQAALAFLRHHPGQVSPITLTLFGNDMPLLLNPCTAVNGQIDLNCVQAAAPGFIAGLTERISNILRQLRSAAPNAEIIVMGGWDEFLDALAFADPLYQGFNAALADAAADNRARFANPFPIFNPQGNAAKEVQTICTLTLLCIQNDVHPSDAGYRALADLVFDVSDYARLGR
ncbi:MAG TPA: SGNH/GDSL hydrolase family protein, partial [Bryobacteraceae bacterium]